MHNALRAAAHELSPQLVAWRRHLHAHPELSGQEYQTARYVADELQRLGWDVVRDVGGTTGLVGLLRVGSGPAVALRADMDALPVQEETGLEYASCHSGVMHACGHDAHVAMLLGAAHLLMARKDALRHPVKLIFQPSEELPPGGALPMIEAGVLDDVDRVLGLHIWSEMPVGSLGTRVGPFMSSVSDLRVVVTGMGGHAAMPQQCVDPIVVAAQIITGLQTVVSRSIAMTDSAVVSITRVSAGTANNVIPGHVELGGTIRTLSEAVRAVVERRATELIEGTAQAYGGSAAVELTRGYPVLVNDAGTVTAALAAARAVGFQECELLSLPAQGGGEDFAYYAERKPAAFLFLGARSAEKSCVYPHHHARFDVDEDALPLGAGLLARFALSGG